jgi:hypothetical protein
MLTNYIYEFRLNEYNIKIKSHIVLKYIMYSTTLYYKLILSFWKWFIHTNIYTIYNTSTTYYTSFTWFLQYKGNTSITYYTSFTWFLQYKGNTSITYYTSSKFL